MRNIMLKLGYDGTNYSGWQRQGNAVAVQQAIEEALFKLFRSEVTLTGCGRTDRGVHAREYICNFYTDSGIDNQNIINALNTFIPSDIIVYDCKDVLQGFHSRYTIKSKKYIYTIDNSKYGDIFQRNFSWHYKFDLDFDKMAYASKAFLGTHDFRGFMSTGTTPNTTIRTIHDIEMKKTGEIIKIAVCGNGFLYNMVRIIAGTLVSVGSGRINKDALPEIIKSCDRTKAGITAPAKGLCLWEIGL